MGISQRPRQSEEKNYAHIIYHTDSEQYQRGVLFTESGGEMSRLNVLEDIHACGGTGDSKGRGLSGIDTSQVFVMIVCMLNKLFPVLLLKLHCHVVIWD